MDLDRSRRASQIVGDRLVGMAVRQSLEDFLFPGGQAGDADLRFGGFDGADVGIVDSRERSRDGLEQSRLLERLFQKIDRAGFHRLHRNRDITMSRQDDDRHVDAAFGHRRLHLETIHVRHPDIEDDAAGLGRPCRLQKLNARCVGDDLIARGLQREAGSLADGLFIVDQMYGSSILHRLPPPARGLV